MKYLLTLTFVLFAISATAQTSHTVTASNNNFAISYDHTPDNILFASLNVGNKGFFYTSASITFKPVIIDDKIFDILHLEPFAYFEYGYNGNTLRNYGFGATQKITDNISISGKYSTWGFSASITLR